MSAVCQAALERAVRDVTAARATDEPPDATTWTGLFARFTPRARQAVTLAQEAARAVPHNYVGTEHLLLGLLDEGGNMALRVLAALDIDEDDLRAELAGSMPRATRRVQGHIPFTPRAKATLELAAKESMSLGHNYVGCEHLLLGLLAVEDAIASKVLRRMGLELRTTRMAVTRALVELVSTRSPPAVPADSPRPRTRSPRSWNASRRSSDDWKAERGDELAAGRRVGTARRTLRRRPLRLAARAGPHPRDPPAPHHRTWRRRCRSSMSGGGAGTQSIPLARVGHHVTIVDPSPAMLERADAGPRRRGRGGGRGGSGCVEANGEVAPEVLDGQTFGAVLCHGVLMYLDDPEPMVDALCRLTAPSGVLSIVAKNVQVMAMRPAHEGDWAGALAAFDHDRQINGLGVDTRGDDVEHCPS